MKKNIIHFMLLVALSVVPMTVSAQDVVLDFDSQSGMEFEYIRLSSKNILQNKTAFTIEFRFNNVWPDHAATYFAQQNGDENGTILMERWFGDNYVRIGGAGMAKWGFDPEDGVWHHYAIVYDGSGSTNDDRLKIYLDGQLQTIDSWQGTIPSSIPNVDTWFYIGCKHYGLGMIGQDIEGQYEEFRIWDKALSASEIINVVNYDANGSEDDLFGFFGFNEGVPNGNNAGITDIPFNGSISGHLEGFMMEGDYANFVGANAGILVGIPENIFSNEVSLYPNPNIGQFSIELTELSRVQITSITGKLVLDQTLDSGKHPIDITEFGSGLYFVNIINAHQIQIAKVIVE
ncbi:MAG: LamG-like jellyroll fold domain-containing protein [Bacteroidota bacterium]